MRNKNLFIQNKMHIFKHMHLNFINIKICFFIHLGHRQINECTGRNNLTTQANFTTLHTKM